MPLVHRPPASSSEVSETPGCDRSRAPSTLCFALYTHSLCCLKIINGLGYKEMLGQLTQAENSCHYIIAFDHANTWVHQSEQWSTKHLDDMQVILMLTTSTIIPISIQWKFQPSFSHLGSGRKYFAKYFIQTEPPKTSGEPQQNMFFVEGAMSFTKKNTFRKVPGLLLHQVTPTIGNPVSHKPRALRIRDSQAWHLELPRGGESKPECFFNGF